MGTVTVERKALRLALQAVTRVARKSNTPQVTGVRLKARNGTLELVATDLKCSVLLDIPRIGGSGKFEAVLPAARLAEYVRKSKRAEVKLKLDGKTPTLDGATKMVAPCSPEDFPELPELKGKPALTIKAHEFVLAARSTLFAASREEIRYALTGVLLEAKGESVHFVASDGMRLVHYDAVRYGGKGEHQATIPAAALDLVARLADKAAAAAPIDVRIDKAGMQAAFRIGDARVTTKLIEGQFPNWRIVMPKGKAKAFKIDRAELADALARVAVATTETNRAARFRFGGGKLELWTRSKDVGETTVEIPAKGSGKHEVVLNPYYVLDYLKALPKGQETVTFERPEGKGATRWTSFKRHRYVLMPLVTGL